jgi:hypothetical protein
MKEMYRITWVLVMLDVVEAAVNRSAPLAAAARRSSARAVRRLCRAPDEQMHSMIRDRLRRAKAT